MGGKESKHFPITYDEAVKRVSESEKRRLQDAFRRSSGANSNISKQVLIQEVLGERVPVLLSEQIFSLVGGGRAVSFRELLTLLVLVTRGTREEKFKCTSRHNHHKRDNLNSNSNSKLQLSMAFLLERRAHTLNGLS